jgi:hypothetical protein
MNLNTNVGRMKEKMKPNGEFSSSSIIFNLLHVAEAKIPLKISGFFFFYSLIHIGQFLLINIARHITFELQ